MNNPLLEPVQDPIAELLQFHDVVKLEYCREWHHRVVAALSKAAPAIRELQAENKWLKDSLKKSLEWMKKKDPVDGTIDYAQKIGSLEIENQNLRSSISKLVAAGNHMVFCHRESVHHVDQMDGFIAWKKVVKSLEAKPGE